MKPVKWLIVAGMEHLCGVLDTFWDLGCLLRISYKASELDDRWGTGYWRKLEAES